MAINNNQPTLYDVCGNRQIVTLWNTKSFLANQLTALHTQDKTGTRGDRQQLLGTGWLFIWTEFKSIYLQWPTLPQLRLNLQRAVADIMAQGKRVVTKTQLGPTWLVGVDNISQLVRYYCFPSVWVMGTPQRHTHTRISWQGMLQAVICTWYTTGSQCEQRRKYVLGYILEPLQQAVFRLPDAAAMTYRYLQCHTSRRRTSWIFWSMPGISRRVTNVKVTICCPLLMVMVMVPTTQYDWIYLGPN